MFSSAMLLTLAVTNAGAPSPTKWVSNAAGIQFVVEHPFHTVVGKSNKGQAILLIAGRSAKAMARVPVATFDSGNANRDAHMLEIVAATEHPMATVQLAVKDFDLPDPGQKVKLNGEAEVVLRGVKNRVPVELEILRKDETGISVSFSFITSLDTHHVERPSLMFVQIEDAVKLSGTFELRRK